MHTLEYVNYAGNTGYVDIEDISRVESHPIGSVIRLKSGGAIDLNESADSVRQRWDKLLTRSRSPSVSIQLEE